MRRLALGTVFALGVVAVGALSFVACGSDDGTPPAGNDAGDAAVPPDGGAPDAAPSDGATTSDADASSPPADAGGGEALWAKHYGESGDVTPIAVGVDGTGAVILAGELAGTINLANTGPSGTEALTTTAGGYVGKLDSSGAHVWSKKWTSTTQGVYPVTIAVDKSNGLFFAGQLFGTANLGGQNLVSGGTYAAFVAKLDASGNHVWSKSFDGGNGSSAYALSVATDSVGDVIVAGQFSGSIGFGGNLLTSAGSRDYFLVKLGGSDGHHIWSYRYGDAADQSGIAVATDPANDGIVVIGRFAGSLDLGGGPMVGNGTSGFVAHLDKNASHDWSKLLLTAQPTGVATASNGDVVYTGRFTGTVDFSGTGNAGSEVLTAKAIDVFVTRLASSGAHKFSRDFHAPAYIDSVGVGVSPSGDVAFTGQFRNAGPVDFSAGGVSGPSLACPGSRAFYTASLSATGGYRWAFCIGPASTFQEGTGIAVASTGHVIVNGDYYQNTTPSIAFPKTGGGAITLPRTSSVDAFVAKLAP